MANTLMKNSFSPINKAHAILEVVFIQFAPDFPVQAIRKLMEVEHELKEELPKVSPINRIETTLERGEDGPKGQFIERPVGIELQRIRPDGSVEWMLRTTENIIAVHCLDYSTWGDVWGRAREYFHKTFGRIEGESNFVISIGLKYIDRFLYEGTKEEYDSSLLFKKDTDLISKKSFLATPLWHCHSGWFDESFDAVDAVKGDLLNQLNVDSSYANVSGQKRYITTIEHNAIIRIEGQDNGHLRSITEKTDAKDSCLDQLMDKLHNTNKKVLSNLLSEQMAIKINLGTPK